MIATPVQLVCDVCAGPAFAVAPGSEEHREAGILLCRGEPVRCWCLSHWLAAHRRAA